MFKPFIVILSLAVIGSPAVAQDLKKGVTSLKDVDADFAIQGEYLGSLCPSGYWQSMGLQVVALGDGQFEALLYPGGLPGWGATSTKAGKLKGKRDDGAVTLANEELSFRLTDGQLACGTASGRPVGQLQKVQRSSPTLGAQPPCNATVLFNGTKPELLKNATVTEEGWLNIGTETVKPYGSFTLHGEFRIPYMPYARSQARGNSGFYLQKRYEVQVLDSFGLEPQFNDSASLYRTKAPDLNMALPPLTWQTYDIHFTAAKFDADGKKLSPTTITVWHNGVMVQNAFELPNKTGAGQPEGPTPLPILLQNHGNPVHFRNLWLVEHDAADPSSSVIPLVLASAGLQLTNPACVTVATNCESACPTRRGRWVHRRLGR